MLEDSTLDPSVATIASMARQPVSLGAAARARLALAVEAEASAGLPNERARPLSWVFETRPLRLSPLAGLALAAGLVGIGVAVGVIGRTQSYVAPAGPLVRQTPAIARGGMTPSGDPAVPAGASSAQITFVLVAPQASHVTVVGNFNNWNPGVHPMQRTPTGGTWTVTVPLAAGRHEYSFVVDGTHWIPDPSAPLAAEDGFGVANSVLLVSGSTS